jgi:hypothetical protein
MNKMNLVISLCFSVGLMAGCSNKPGIGEVKDQVVEAWKSCGIVKPTDFKKTNGVDNGNNYEIAATYKIEIVKDIPKGNPLQPEVPAGLNDADFAELRSISSISPAAAPSDDATPEVKAEYAKTQQAVANRATIEKRIEARKAPYLAAHQQAKEFYENNCMQLAMPLFDFARKNGKNPYALAKGDVIDVSANFTMIKSDNGWVIQ